MEKFFKSLTPFNVSLASPKAVLFDWDGVIVDSEEEIFLMLHETFQAFGLQGPTREDFYRSYGYSIQDVFKRDFKEKWSDAKDLYYTLQNKMKTKRPKIFKEVTSFLEHLNKRNIYCAVVSNKRGDLLREEASLLNLSQYFSKIVGAGDASRGKPYRDPVDYALKEVKLDPHHAPIWFIGDREVDMECAHRTSCIPIEAVFHESKVRKDYIYPPFLSISSYNDLIKILK